MATELTRAQLQDDVAGIIDVDGAEMLDAGCSTPVRPGVTSCAAGYRFRLYRPVVRSATPWRQTGQTRPTRLLPQPGPHVRAR